jgi:hypothetical protein
MMNTNANNDSFQVNMNVRMATETTMGWAV